MKPFLACLLAALCIVPAWPETAENLLLVTYDGLRFQEVFGGADARLLAPESRQTENASAIKESYWAETPEERRERLLPFLWSTVVRNGQLFGDSELGSATMVTNGRNFSYPGYNEILTGAKDDRIKSNAKRDNPNVTVLEWLNEQSAFEGKVAAFCSWDVFPFIINTKRSGLPMNAGWEGRTESVTSDRLTFTEQLAAETPHYWAGVRFDAFTYYPAVEYVQHELPRVIYIGFGETDDWAHDGRYDMYLESARRTDAYIEHIWNLLQSVEQYAGKTALLITTDHGRGDTVEDWTSHNATIEGCDHVWIAAMGVGVDSKGVVENMPTTQGQVAATAAALLGLDFHAAHTKSASAIALAD